MWYLIWGVGMAAVVGLIVLRTKRAESEGVYKSADDADQK